jgi:large subunit ribosomal protein L40e
MPPPLLIERHRRPSHLPLCQPSQTTPNRSSKYTTFSSPAVASPPQIPPTAPPRHHFQVFVKTLTGKSITVTVSPTDPVSTLKVLIFTKTGIPPADQRINYNGKHLADHANIAAYCIRPNSLLHTPLSCLVETNTTPLPDKRPNGRHRRKLHDTEPPSSKDKPNTKKASID